MVTKEKREEELNEILDTDIEWSKMKAEDLETIMEMLDSGKMVDKSGRHIAKEEGKEALEAMVDNWEYGDILKRVIL